MRFKTPLLLAIMLSMLTLMASSCTERDSGSKTGVTAMVTHNEFTVSPLTTDLYTFETSPATVPCVRLFSQPEKQLNKILACPVKTEIVINYKYRNLSRLLTDERCNTGNYYLCMNRNSPAATNLLSGVRTRWLSEQHNNKS